MEHPRPATAPATEPRPRAEPPAITGSLPRIGDHASILAHGAAELRLAFGPRLGEDTVDRIVAESVASLSPTAADPAHRESIVIRFAHDRLAALAAAEGVAVRTVPHVLFVCVQNAGRSQLAAALLTARAGDALRVSSAGSRPARAVHDTVEPVLEEIGAEPEDAFPKPITDEVLASADYVITMGCGDECPVRADQDVRDWPVGDPAEADWERLQAIVADIEARVDALWREIGPA